MRPPARLHASDSQAERHQVRLERSFAPACSGPFVSLPSHLPRVVRVADHFPEMFYETNIQPFLAHSDIERTRRLNRTNYDAPRLIPARGMARVFRFRPQPTDHVFMTFSACMSDVSLTLWSAQRAESVVWPIQGKDAKGSVQRPSESWSQSIATHAQRDFSAEVSGLFTQLASSRSRASFASELKRANMVDVVDTDGFWHRLRASNKLLEAMLWNGMCRLHATTRARELPVLSRGGALVAFLAPGSSSSIIAWDLAQNAPVGSYRTPTADGIWEFAIESWQTRRLVVQTYKRAIYTWDLDRPAHRTTVRDPLGPVALSRFAKQLLAISPDGISLAAVAPSRLEGETVSVWDLASPGPARSIELASQPRAEGTMTTLRFSPNSALLAAGGDSGFVRVWELSSGQEVYACDRHRDAVTALAWSPDGKVLATYSVDGTARIAQVQSCPG